MEQFFFIEILFQEKNASNFEQIIVRASTKFLKNYHLFQIHIIRIFILTNTIINIIIIFIVINN